MLACGKDRQTDGYTELEYRKAYASKKIRKNKKILKMYDNGKIRNFKKCTNVTKNMSFITYNCSNFYYKVRIV